MAEASYRYTLTRNLNLGQNADVSGRVCFVMLNPSTADETLDDPTIRRCKGFARDWAFAELVVVNLFAVRSTDPKALGLFDDPVGPDNERHVIDAMADSNRVVAAWGAHQHPMIEERRRWLKWTAFELGKALWCLGTTKAGHPRHPLYVAANTPLSLFDEEVLP